MSAPANDDDVKALEMLALAGCASNIAYCRIPPGRLLALLARLRRAEAALETALDTGHTLALSGNILRQWARPPCPEQHCQVFDEAYTHWRAMIATLAAQEATNADE